MLCAFLLSIEIMSATCGAGIKNAELQEVSETAKPKGEYVLFCNTTGHTPVWDVAISASGLSQFGPNLSMYLEDWGHWLRVDSYYLANLESTPPIRQLEQDKERFTFDLPSNWDGRIQLRYQLRLTHFKSQAHKNNSALPVHGDNFAIGFAQNTLMRIQADDKTIDADLTMTLVGPANWTVFSGWAGISKETQTFAWNHPERQAVLAFGVPLNRIEAHQDSIAYEIVQFGDTTNATRATFDVVSRLTPAIYASTATTLDTPLRVFIAEPNGGGTHTDYGIRLGHDNQRPSHQLDSEYFKYFVGHELFHCWLGGKLKATDKSMVWFYEGFTDYFALWHSVQTGLIHPSWFANRLLEIDQEAKQSDSYYESSFADRNVRWRDGDGDNETLAYKKAPVLAFCLDVELRRQGQPGLLQLLRDFLQAEDGRYSQETFKEWLCGHGLKTMYEDYVEGTDAPELIEALEYIGFEPQEKPTPLTYFGIRDEGKFGNSTIVELDPQGPAQAAGCQVGDVIVGLYPVRTEPLPGISDTVDTPYRFGLNRFHPNVEGTFLSVKRNGEKMRFYFKPSVIEGGYFHKFGVDGLDDTNGFFTFEP